MVAARSGHPFSKKPTLENYCRMQHLLVAPRAIPRASLTNCSQAAAFPAAVALAVPNFLLALDLLTKTELVCSCPRGLSRCMRRALPSAPQGCRWILARQTSRRSCRSGRSWT